LTNQETWIPTTGDALHRQRGFAIHWLKSHQNFKTWFYQKWEILESPSSLAGSFSEDCCWSSCFLLLSTLYLLGLGSGNSCSLEAISEDGILYDVESSSPESVAYYQCSPCLPRRRIEDAALCVCVSGLRRACATLSVTVRYMETARRQHGGPAEARRRLVIDEL
jgi:hypothetical protein